MRKTEYVPSRWPCWSSLHMLPPFLRNRQGPSNGDLPLRRLQTDQDEPFLPWHCPFPWYWSLLRSPSPSFSNCFHEGRREDQKSWSRETLWQGCRLFQKDAGNVSVGGTRRGDESWDRSSWHGRPSEFAHPRVFSCSGLLECWFCDHGDRKWEVEMGIWTKNISWVTRIKQDYAPFTLGRNKVIQPQFPVNLLQSQVYGIVVELSLRNTGGRDGSGKTRDLGLLVSPAAASFARSIGVNWGE